ncbi:MAG TPA: ABC transporter substrate-binding protein [Ktedonobacteraceae bacterium]
MARLHALLVTPLTGSLALFGQASAHGLSLWARSAASLPAPWTGVELEIRDSGNDTGAAIRAALQNRPAVLFGPYGSNTMLKAARSCERVIWNHGGATSHLSWPAFPRVINVLAPASTYFTGVLRAIHAFDATANTVSLLHSTSGFARDVTAGALATAATLQMKVRTTSFEPTCAADALAAVSDGAILLVAGGFADELTAAAPLLARKWRFAAFVSAGVEEVLAPLGKMREGLLGPAQWLAGAAPLPEEGPGARWFTAAYRASTGTEPSYPAVQAFAAGLLYARCLRDMGNSEDDAQLAAARHLTCTTLYGPFRLDPLSGLQTGHQVLTVQWQQGQRRVVWPPEQAERSLLPLRTKNNKRL